MVIYGLTVIIFSSTQSNAAVSVLLLTFLVPAVLFSAVAGVYVDRHDRRLDPRGDEPPSGRGLRRDLRAQRQLAVVFLANIFVSTVTTFFGPAEAAMIPHLVPQGAAAVGERPVHADAQRRVRARLRAPRPARGHDRRPECPDPRRRRLLPHRRRAVLHAAPRCRHRRPRVEAGSRRIVAAEHAIGTTLAQLREGLGYIRDHRNISWSLIYLGITASLIGVLGVLGPDFATDALGLAPKDFVVVVLPLGLRDRDRDPAC